MNNNQIQENRTNSGDYSYSKTSFKNLAESDADDVQKIAATQLELLDDYHKEVLQQAKKSFNVAVGAGIVGLIFFLAVLLNLVKADSNQKNSFAVVGTISGALIEVISGLNFYLYGKASAQMSNFQKRLDKTQRYLIANSICSCLSEDFRDASRSELVKIIAGAELFKDDTLKSDEVVDEPMKSE